MKYYKALIAVLIWIGAMSVSTVSHAGVTLCAEGGCNIEVIYPVEVIEIGPIAEFPVHIRPSALQLIPFKNEDGWNYAFALSTQAVASLKLPYFGDWSLEQAVIPDNWSVAIGYDGEALLPVAYWNRTNEQADTGTILLSYVSQYAPALAGLTILTTYDKQFQYELWIPLSPEAMLAGFGPATLPVPEPSSVALLSLGLILLFARRRQAAWQR
ncbi:PEP-CTERM sorting domain-containing protein [Methylobacillus sp. Pita1]|uniref:PEP-CTERM sorting domain-containing protein n=1 Tax=Methylobacillus sp. Pita1 TaxID=3382642 RepID=UPI0038B62DD1